MKNQVTGVRTQKSSQVTLFHEANRDDNLTGNKF